MTGNANNSIIYQNCQKNWADASNPAVSKLWESPSRYKDASRLFKLNQ